MRPDLLGKELALTLEEEQWVPSEFGLTVKWLIASWSVGRLSPIKNHQTEILEPTDVAFNPAPRERHRSGCYFVRVLLCRSCSIPLLGGFPAGTRTWGPIRRHKGSCPLIWSFRWPHWAVQIDVGKAVGINCNDWPFYCLVYSLAPSRLQFLESLVTHFSTKCK